MFESSASNPAVSTRPVLREEMSEIPWRRAAAAPDVRSDCGSRLRTTHRPLLAVRGCHLMLERCFRHLARLRPLRFDGQHRVTALLRSVRHEACRCTTKRAERDKSAGRGRIFGPRLRAIRLTGIAPAAMHKPFTQRGRVWLKSVRTKGPCFAAGQRGCRWLSGAHSGESRGSRLAPATHGETTAQTATARDAHLTGHEAA